MSMNQSHILSEPVLPSLNYSTAESSPSSSSSSSTPRPAAPQLSPSELRQPYLDVPSNNRPSRPSLDSTYSELSELSFRSNELQNRRPLVRSISQDASPPQSRWARIVAALRLFYLINYGAMLVLLAQFFGVGMNILFVRQSITASLCTAYGVYTKSVPDFPLGPRDTRWLLVARGIFGFMGVFGMYFSLLYLPLSEATVLTFLSPIISCYLCSFIIPGETFTGQQQLAGLVSLLGVIFIAQPASLFSSGSSNATDNPALQPDVQPADPSQSPAADKHLLAIGIAMIGVIGSTGAYTAIRAIGTRAHAFISINYFSVWCTIVSLFCLIVFPDVTFRLPGNGTEWTLLVSLGVCGFIMQFLLTAGLAYGGPSTQSHNEHKRAAKVRDLEIDESSAIEHSDEQVSSANDTQSGHPTSVARGSGTRATSMVYTQMLFALAGDKWVFGITPTTVSWIGSVLILAGAVWVAAARDTASKSSTATQSSGALVTSVARTAQGKNEGTTEEVVGLMQSHEAGELEPDESLEMNELRRLSSN
ncbi:hypothetical protein LTR10_013423 [Elasticomyces elasticus]|uniref:EamA domain-containing protein n=1 Tax=Exophiala sideris TaxID=1016849 RepID=A0ABR0J4H7_9EURO|nr:hypothetical protein LTR10_013423 [Elasticomyces elasticus]KAK5034951.1 hypothetical protein LTR13_006133 [Exophiala sideris]KAK5056315.1 hypothetical protein LTR69_007856 [Exophiala sideris]KAK5181196.1 hypothetical protein LTR44_006527 [Eurotiomycetes sp. CCFEE 6388]